MSANEGEMASIQRAAQRTALAARALIGAGDDLEAAGARGAAQAVFEEADRLDQLAGEIRKLEKAGAGSR